MFNHFAVQQTTQTLVVENDNHFFSSQFCGLAIWAGLNLQFF